MGRLQGRLLRLCGLGRIKDLGFRVLGLLLEMGFSDWQDTHILVLANHFGDNNFGMAPGLWMTTQIPLTSSHV